VEDIVEVHWEVLAVRDAKHQEARTETRGRIIVDLARKLSDGLLAVLLGSHSEIALPG
jgi:hypothetical protein